MLVGSMGLGANPLTVSRGLPPQGQGSGEHQDCGVAHHEADPDPIWLKKGVDHVIEIVHLLK